MGEESKEPIIWRCKSCDRIEVGAHGINCEDCGAFNWTIEIVVKYGGIMSNVAV